MTVIDIRRPLTPSIRRGVLHRVGHWCDALDAATPTGLLRSA